MTRVLGSVLELIRETPLVRLSKVLEAGCGHVLGKLKSLNSGGSIKDRVALALVEHAEKEGRLQRGNILVEALGGNTGVSLALVAAVKGYRIILVMPDNVPPDRQRLLMRFGVEVRLTPSYLGMEGSHRAVREIEASNPRAVALNLFSNPVVVEVHANATAHEIVLGTGGKLDAFVAGVGTGGT